MAEGRVSQDPPPPCFAIITAISHIFAYLWVRLHIFGVHTLGVYLWGRSIFVAYLCIFGVRPICIFGSLVPWGQTDFLGSLGSDSSWGCQTSLSLGSDRFRIFSHKKFYLSLGVYFVLGVRPI